MTTTVGVIDWTIEEIKEIDIRTRKHLTISGNFHPNGDVDKLYLPRSQGGQGVKMIARVFESRIISNGQYLTIKSNSNNVMSLVCEQEQQNIIRLQHKLLESYNIQYDETSTPKHLSKQFMKADLTAQRERYTSKVMRGYYERKIANDTQIDKHLSNSWKRDKSVTSQLENYHSTIQDQELPTKYLKNRRARDGGKTPDYVPPMLKTKTI